MIDAKHIFLRDASLWLCTEEVPTIRATYDTSSISGLEELSYRVEEYESACEAVRKSAVKIQDIEEIMGEICSGKCSEGKCGCMIEGQFYKLEGWKAEIKRIPCDCEKVKAPCHSEQCKGPERVAVLSKKEEVRGCTDGRGCSGPCFPECPEERQRDMWHRVHNHFYTMSKENAMELNTKLFTITRNTHGDKGEPKQ